MYNFLNGGLKRRLEASARAREEREAKKRRLEEEQARARAEAERKKAEEEERAKASFFHWLYALYPSSFSFACTRAICAVIVGWSYMRFCARPVRVKALIPFRTDSTSLH